MKYKFKSKILSLLLCVSMLMPMLVQIMPAFTAHAIGIEPSEDHELSYNIGKQAIFDWWSEFLLVDTETLMNSTADEMYDYYGSYESGYENWVLYSQAFDKETGEPEDTPYLDANDLVLIIEDYHYDEENGFHWYKLGPREGESVPEILENKPWVLYTLDDDIEYGYDPYLAIYERDEVVRIINASVNSISSVRYVLAGPESFADATVSITDHGNEAYNVSSLAYDHETDGIWSDAIKVEINKANGEKWTSEDGIVSIRYTEAQIATTLYSEDVFFGAAYLYVNDEVYSAAVTDKTGCDASDVVYTNSGTSVIVFEIMIPEFDWWSETGYFTNEAVTLYNNTFESCVFPAAKLPLTFSAAYIFTYEGEDYYWLEADKDFLGNPYFLVKTDEVTFGELPEEFGDGRVTIVDENEAPISEINLEQYEKPEYSALSSLSSIFADVSFKWQIEYEDGKWVDIYGENSDTVKLSYGMIAGLLDENGTVNIRCESKAKSKIAYSRAIPVTLEMYLPEDPDEEGSEEISIPQGESFATYALNFDNQWAPKEPTNPIAPKAEGDTTLYNVVVNYIFENGSIAATPYTSKIGVTGSLNDTVEFPTVVGYLPYVNDVRQDEYKFELLGSSMTEDFVLNVIYKPTLVNYTVVVMLQNTYNDNYTEHERKTLQALTGTVISSDTEVGVNYPGFYQLLHKQVTVAADGSTQIEVRFDRYYYLMTFDLGEGGYGVLPVYARYGTNIEVGEPTRPGYYFEGWTDPTGAAVTFPMSMPEHDIEITAKWTPGNAKYTIVYWKENADPNADGTYGYSYWGSRIVTTLSGSVVSGKDDIPTSITNAEVDGSTVNEKVYFTYNDSRTDKEVVVKGDGTTVVNVYYTRNYYTIYFKGYGKCCLTPHTHGTGCNSGLICTLEEHAHTDCPKTVTCGFNEHSAHTDACLKCTKKVHTAHTDACLQCTHTHTRSCYTNRTLTVANANNLSNNPESAFNRLIALLNGSDPVNGMVYRSRRSSYNTTNYNFLYFDNTWYYLGSGDQYSNITVNNIGTPSYNEYASAPAIANRCNHQHTASCYIDELHTHDSSCYNDTIHAHNDSCYKYNCGKVVHSHSDGCYSECTIVAHSHGNTCTSNNTSNVIYVITAKYEATIGDIWPTYDKLKEGEYAYEDSSGNVENANGSRFRGWSVDGISATATSKRINMTADLCDTSDGEKNATGVYGYSYYVHLYYMFESFDQTSPANGNERKYYNGKYYDRSGLYYQNVYGGTNSFSQKEIMGMAPVGTQSVQVTGSEYNNFLYYTRNRSDLIYQNIDTVVDTKTGIMFGESIKNYQFAGTPDYPSSLEAGAYEFGGWYTTAGCFDGTEVDFNSATMPNGDMILYAKWVPVTHTVEFYKQKVDGNVIGKIGETYEVKHNQKLNEQYIPEAPEDFENGAYSFAGWWYMDGDTERRFDFKSLPVTQNLVVYAKWTSNKQIQYNFHFVLADGTPVADSVSSSDLAGTTVTEFAKGGMDLYPAYREGYFPNVKSHSITLDIDDEDGIMEYTFVYSPADAVPYTVYYVAKTLKAGGTSLGTVVLNGENYFVIYTTKTVGDNRYSYVSENFVPVAGYVPDDFQKNLVITPGNENVIVFYYSVDTQNAPFKVTHYIQNLDGETWTVERSYSGIAEIGSTYTENPMTTLVGFTYDPSISKSTGQVSAEGLELKLYYIRNKYPYKVVYKVQSTGEVLYSSDPVNEYYGKVVAATAPDTFGNYTRISEATLSITVRIEQDPSDPTVNVITSFYEETEVTINYEVVGPNGCGSVNPESESVKISSGKANGSTATPSNNYKFVGWYSDEACTNLVSKDLTFVPQKVNGLNVSATYYAKFDYNLTSLTVRKEGWSELDPYQTFIFNIKGNGIDIDVTVHGNGYVTIDGLTVGATYTVTEKTDWSWRYECEGWTHSNGGSGAGNVATVQIGVNGTVTFTNKRATSEDSNGNHKWLDGNSWCNNLFK